MTDKYYAYVQFSDESEEVIISEFSSPQDKKGFPNQGKILKTDPRYLKFLEKINRDKI